MSTEIINESEQEIDVEHVAKLARFLLEQLRVHPQADLRIKFGDEATITELNERYFDTEGPTDVLSFPVTSCSPAASTRSRRRATWAISSSPRRSRPSRARQPATAPWRRSSC